MRKLVSGRPITTRHWIVIASAVGLAVILSASGCWRLRPHEYWTVMPCEKNPSDDGLKKEVAAELAQYAKTFSEYLENAVYRAGRNDLSALEAIRIETSQPAIPDDGTGTRIENAIAGTGRAAVPLRITVPCGVQDAENIPVVIYMHGGGWMFGSAAGSGHITAGICRASQALVVSVEYRLAPENPYPAALDDCVLAVQWAREKARNYGGNPSCIFVAGDSAGGNLAAATAIRESKSGRSVQGLILYYPAVNLGGAKRFSMRRFARGYGLDATLLEAIISCYAPNSAERSGSELSPGNADPQNIPPSLIIAAQFDILHDDARAFAERLHEGGNRARYVCMEGVTHAYLDSASCAHEFTVTMDETAGFIRRLAATSSALSSRARTR